MRTWTHEDGFHLSAPSLQLCTFSPSASVTLDAVERVEKTARNKDISGLYFKIKTSIKVHV